MSRDLTNEQWKRLQSLSSPQTPSTWRPASNSLVLLRLAVGRNSQPRLRHFDSRTLQSTCESGQRAGYDGAKRTLMTIAPSTKTSFRSEKI